MAPSALFNPMSQQLCHAHRQKSAAAGNDRFAVWPQLPALKIATAHGREFTTVGRPLRAPGRFRNVGSWPIAADWPTRRFAFGWDFSISFAPLATNRAFVDRFRLWVGIETRRRTTSPGTYLECSPGCSCASRHLGSRNLLLLPAKSP